MQKSPPPNVSLIVKPASRPPERGLGPYSTRKKCVLRRKFAREIFPLTFPSSAARWESFATPTGSALVSRKTTCWFTEPVNKEGVAAVPLGKFPRPAETCSGSARRMRQRAKEPGNLGLRARFFPLSPNSVP
jgi:hypothetical protein